MITLLSSMAVITLTLFIAYYSKANLALLEKLLSSVATSFDSSITALVLVFLLVFFLELANILQIGFTGLILGHTMQTNKTLYSIILGFAVYMISQTFVLMLSFIVALFIPELMNLFITNQATISIGAIKTIIWLSIFAYTALLFIVYFINVKLFNKGVNVD